MTRSVNEVSWAAWEPDTSQIAGPGRKAKGVIADAGQYVPLQDLALHGSGQLQDSCIGARGFYDQSGGVRVFLGDASTLYELVQGMPKSVSRPEGYEADSSTGWSFTQFGNIVLASARGVPLQYLEIGGTGEFQDVPGAPPADSVFTVREHALVGYNNELHWSGFNNPLVWDLTRFELQPGFAFFPQEGGRILAGIGSEVGYVFQERMISRLTYVGGQTVWQRDTAENNRGAIGRRAIAAYGRTVMYVSEDGMFAFDGMQSQPIGDNKVNRHFVKRLNYAQRHRTCCAFDTGRKAWMVAYPAEGATIPNEVMIFSLTDGRWTHDEIDLQMLFDMPIPGVTFDDDAALQQLVGTTILDQISESVDSPLFSDSRRQWGAVDLTNRLATFTGPNRAAALMTTDFEAIKGRQTYFSEIWPLVDAPHDDVRVTVRTRRARQADSVLEETSAQTLEGFCPVRAEGRYASVEMNIDAGVDWTETTGLQWNGKPAGDR